MQTAINPDEDIRIVMDEPYYTRSGALKMMGIKSTTLSKEISSHKIEVFRHPTQDLFSKEAILAWVTKRTSKAK